jgi:hypothetical protein
VVRPSLLLSLLVSAGADFAARVGIGSGAVCSEQTQYTWTAIKRHFGQWVENLQYQNPTLRHNPPALILQFLMIFPRCNFRRVLVWQVRVMHLQKQECLVEFLALY